MPPKCRPHTACGNGADRERLEAIRSIRRESQQPRRAHKPSVTLLRRPRLRVQTRSRAVQARGCTCASRNTRQKARRRALQAIPRSAIRMSAPYCAVPRNTRDTPPRGCTAALRARARAWQAAHRDCRPLRYRAARRESSAPCRPRQSGEKSGTTPPGCAAHPASARANHFPTPYATRRPESPPSRG